MTSRDLARLSCRVPFQLLEHFCDAALTAEVVIDKSGGTSLNLYYFVYVRSSMWTPNCGGVLDKRTD